MLCLGQEVNCTECSASKARFSLDQVKAALSNPDEEDDEGEDISDAEIEADGVCVTDESDEESDDSTSEDEDEDNEEEDSDIFIEGDLVWAPLGSKKFPAQIIGLAAVPSYLHRQLITKEKEHVSIKWIGETDRKGKEVDRFSICPISELLLLGEDTMDQKLAKDCPLRYFQALNIANCS